MTPAELSALVQFATTALQTIPSLLAAGVNVAGMAQATNDSIARMQAEDRGPKPEEWDAMNELIAELRKSIRG